MTNEAIEAAVDVADFGEAAVHEWEEFQAFRRMRAAAMAAPTMAAAPAVTEATPYTGPAGLGQLAAPLQPNPEPPPPPAAELPPHPDETFAPGELAVHEYQDHRDPAGTKRQQLVMVAHQTAEHVAGFVVADLKDLATFARGRLTHYGQAVK